MQFCGITLTPACTDNMSGQPAGNSILPIVSHCLTSRMTLSVEIIKDVTFGQFGGLKAMKLPTQVNLPSRGTHDGPNLGAPSTALSNV